MKLPHCPRHASQLRFYRLLVAMAWGVSCLLVQLLGLTATAQGPTDVQRLPSESLLPGEYRPSGAAITGEQLPPEDRLPGQPYPGQTLPGSEQRVKPSDANPLPPESALPTQEFVQQRNDRDEDELGQDEFDQDLRGEDRPILRLNYNAPTARLRTLKISVDGKRLISGGDGKDLQVWQRDPRDTKKWVHERTIRWQVWRGLRGSIYDAAIAEDRVGVDVIAIAGYGAMGGSGEIWISGADDGKRVRALVDNDQAHQQAVSRVVWSEGAAQLASADLSGAVVVWQPDAATGLWKPKRLVADDRVTFGDQTAAELKRDWRGYHPIAWIGNHVIHPEFASFTRDSFTYPNWNLVSRSIKDGSKQLLTSQTVPGLVTDARASADGNVLMVVCYSDRSVRLYRHQTPTNASSGVWSDWQTIRVDGNPLWAAMDNKNERLVVATESKPGPPAQPATVVSFDLTQPVAKQVSQFELSESSLAGVFDERASTIVITVGAAVETYNIDAAARMTPVATQTLRAPVQPILRVSAHSSELPIRVGIGRSRQANGDKPITEVFNCDENRLLSADDFAEEDFLPNQRLDQKWTIRPRPDTVNRFDWFADDEKIGPFTLPSDRLGNPVALSTYRSSDRQGDLLIVGTDGENGVYVYDVPDLQRRPAATPKLVRYFRGHAGAVRSTSATADGRYLLSGGDDGLVFIWNLQEAGKDANVDRWGATLDAGAMVESIDAAGPLYFRGVRVGDQLTRLQWPDAVGKLQTADAPDTMRQTLQNVATDTQVVFHFSRQGKSIGVFQMYPAWYPLATLLIDDRRQWALWTPAGIYNASVMGNRRFGWQMNRGLDADVDFYTADQFEKALERPAVMRRLLEAGSLLAAMRETIGGVVPPDTSAIVNQIRSRPMIQILNPQPNQVIQTDSIEAQVEIATPPGHSLAGVKAYLDGIPGQQLTRAVTDSGSENVRWRFSLPTQTEMQLKIIALTDGGTVAEETVALKRSLDQNKPTGQPKPQLHLLTVGVGNYRDANIQSLDFPASATHRVAALFRQKAASIYEVTTEQLTDSQGTRSLFQIYASAAVESLRKRVGPDDLVVLYLCGHGLQDRRTQNWYFVTADASYRDLMNDEYSACLSMDDLSAFSGLPCRKLVVLDACHSGAIQTAMRPDDLKSAMRLLQTDQIITLTASEGDEEAAEVIEKGLGRFTNRFIEALEGAADQDHDGSVSVAETVAYVGVRVAEDARRDSMSQHPTASPSDLIERITLPLTSSPASPQSP